jgi:hypothetical protein
LNFYIGNHRSANGAFNAPPVIEGASDVRAQEAGFIQAASAALGHPTTRAETSSYWFEQGWQEIRESPRRWLGLLWTKFRLVFNGQELSNTRSYPFRLELMGTLGPWLFSVGLLAPIALFGFFVCLARAREDWLVVGYAGAMVGALLIMFVLGHYRQVMLPLFVLGAVAAARWFAERRLLGQRNTIIAGLAVVFAFALLANRPVLETSRADDAYKHAYALHQNGDLAQAWHWYDECLIENPQHRSALNNFAILLSDAGEVADALPLWAEVLRLAELDGDLAKAAQARAALDRLGSMVPGDR